MSKIILFYSFVSFVSFSVPHYFHRYQIKIEN